MTGMQTGGSPPGHRRSETQPPSTVLRLVTHDTTADRRAAEQTSKWARAWLSCVQQDFPRYGSPAWVALPRDDPRRWAAILWMAECWRIDSLPHVIGERLRYEMACREQVERVVEAEQDRQLAARVHRMANRPTHAELRRRRGYAPEGTAG